MTEQKQEPKVMDVSIIYEKNSKRGLCPFSKGFCANCMFYREIPQQDKEGNTIVYRLCLLQQGMESLASLSRQMETLTLAIFDLSQKLNAILPNQSQGGIKGENQVSENEPDN